MIMGKTKARLREGEGVIASIALEAGKARVRRLFSHPSIEGFEGQINPNGNVLQDLGMHIFQGSAFLFQHGKGINLSVAGQTFTSLRVSLFAVSKEMVIEPTALFKRLVELLHLLLAWKNPILKRFTHAHMVAQTGQEGKREATPSLPQTRNAFHPLLQRQGLSTDLRGKSVA